MKASVKLREEQPPLWRVKLPFSIAGLELSSGIVVGERRDLSLHLGTCFKTSGTSCKFLYKPENEWSPFSVQCKACFDLWRGPNVGDGAFSTTVEFNLSGRNAPSFTLNVKPKMGDFSLRKQVKSSSQLRVEASQLRVEDGQPRGGNVKPKNGDFSLPKMGGFSLRKQVKSSSQLRVEDGQPIVEDSEARGGKVQSRDGSAKSFRESSGTSNGSPSVSDRVIGSNFCLKIEGLDREKKAEIDREQGVVPVNGGALNQSPFETFVEQDLAAELAAAVGDYEGILPRKPLLFGFRESFKDWSVHTRSSLFLGNWAKLSVGWGTKLQFESSNKRLKLPFLVLNKISVESVVIPQPPNPNMSSPVSVGLLDNTLADVGGLCYAMKEQACYLRAENEGLKVAIEDMRAQLNNKKRGDGSWKSTIPDDLTPIKEHSDKSNPKKSVKEQKGNKDMEGKKKSGSGDTATTDRLSTPSDVSEELKKALMTAADGRNGGKSK